MKYFGITLLGVVISVLVVFKSIRGLNYAIIGICLCVIYINLYGKFVMMDPNRQCLIGKEKKYSGLLDGGCLDVWHVQHLMFWFIIGILWPRHFWAVLVLSVAWEATEHVYLRYFSDNCSSVFCGRVEDVLTNMVGYALANMLL